MQATKGDFLVKAASGEITTKGLTASGALSAGKVGTELWAKGGGAIDGVVFYGNDLAGQKIKNRAGNEVQASKGDLNVSSASADIAANGFSLKGEASFGKVGGELWAKGGGSVDLTYGDTNLKGSATAE